MLCRYTANTYCRNKNNVLLNEFVPMFIYAFLAKASHHYDNNNNKNNNNNN